MSLELSTLGRMTSYNVDEDRVILVGELKQAGGFASADTKLLNQLVPHLLKVADSIGISELSYRSDTEETPDANNAPVEVKICQTAYW